MVWRWWHKKTGGGDGAGKVNVAEIFTGNDQNGQD